MDEIKKDSNDLNWFDDICKWADKYDLNHKDFPRDKTLLENMIQLEICNNNIEEIPSQIKYLTKLFVIMACDNNIKEIPKEIFNLNSLCMLTFTNNKISVIPDEIEKLSLMFLRISNNPLETIPQSLYRKKRLNSLYLHNTKLHTISEDICQLKNLTTLTFDDKHLPTVVKYLSYFPNINSINLTCSNYNETSPLIQNLNLKYDNKELLNKEYKKSNGVIKIFEESTFTLEDYMEDMVEYGLSVVNNEPEEALRMYHETTTIYNLNEKQYPLPDRIVDLSIAIVLSTAKVDMQQAINLLNIIEIEKFRLETIAKLIEKTDDEEYERVLEEMKENIEITQ
jgi:Leucine-rich repeat (LRR) protein